VWLGNAQAIPAFARKYEKDCSYCHNAWPQLNRKGRQFKELGYRMEDELGEDIPISDYGEMGTFPIAAQIVARPYDKRDSGDEKLRAIHEVEIFVAGAVGRHWSGYLEIEAEDENDFSPEIAPAVLAYNHNPTFNVQAVCGPVFWADPYSLLNDAQRLTRGHVSLIDKGFGGADGGGALRGDRQSLTLTGRLFERLFYAAGVSGEADDAEGESAGNLQGRLAFDITKDIMVGAFGINGTTQAYSETEIVADDTTGFLEYQTIQVAERDFSRYGLDVQADLGNTRVQAAWLTAKDDNTSATAEEENKAWTIQALHTFKTRTGKPTWVPLVRYDSYERNDGEEEFNELTLNLSYYLTQNIKGYVEYWDQLDTPDEVEADNRVTLQAQMAF
jgi:hypothetical protein